MCIAAINTHGQRKGVLTNVASNHEHTQVVASFFSEQWDR